MPSHLSVNRGLRSAASSLGVVLVVVLALSSPASAQRDSGAAPLTPPVDAAASLFPYLDGGHALTYRSRHLSVPGSDCVTAESAATAKRGEGATYTLADGSHPSASGDPEPAAEVYKLRSARLAATAFRSVHSYLKRCQGWHPGVRFELKVDPGRNPRLGDEGLAYDLTVRSGDGHHASSKARSVWIVVRRGSWLVRVDVQAPDGTGSPSVRKTVRWARLVLHDLP